MLEIATDGGSPREHAVGALGELVEAPPHHLADALRDRQLPVCHARGAVPASEATLAGEQTHHLADEERVALGLLPDRGDQVSRGLRARGHLHESGHGRGVEAAEHDPATPLDASQLAQRPRERMMATELDVPVGADHQQSGARQLPRHELEELQRGGVRPVEVVEHDHQRARARRRGQERVHRVEEPEARLLPLSLARLRRDAEPLTHLRHDPGHLGAPTPELPGEADRVRLANVGADRLRPGEVGGGALALVAAAPVDLGAAHLCVGRQLLGGAGLADPGLADQRQQAAPA